MFALMNNARLMAGMASGYLRARFGNERGQDLIEYAMLGGLLAVAIGGAALALTMTGALNSMATGVANCINFVSGDGCG
jgi:Flp pilus assembly pilin Flp